MDDNISKTISTMHDKSMFHTLRISAIYLSVTYLKKSARDHLLSIATDEKDDPTVRESAVLALSKLNDPSLAQHLLAMLPKELDAEKEGKLNREQIRGACADALCTLGNNSSLLPLLKSFDEEINYQEGKTYSKSPYARKRMENAFRELMQRETDFGFMFSQLEQFSKFLLSDNPKTAHLAASLFEKTINICQDAEKLRVLEDKMGRCWEKLMKSSGYEIQSKVKSLEAKSRKKRKENAKLKDMFSSAEAMLVLGRALRATKHGVRIGVKKFRSKSN